MTSAVNKIDLSLNRYQKYKIITIQEFYQLPIFKSQGDCTLNLSIISS